MSGLRIFLSPTSPSPVASSRSCTAATLSCASADTIGLSDETLSAQHCCTVLDLPGSCHALVVCEITCGSAVRWIVDAVCHFVMAPSSGESVACRRWISIALHPHHVLLERQENKVGLSAFHCDCPYVLLAWSLFYTLRVGCRFHSNIHFLLCPQLHA